jgi:hypothetical protein
MNKDFKSPVSTISPRGQLADMAAFSPLLAGENSTAQTPRKTGDVGTAARFPAQRHLPIPKSVDAPEFKALFWSRVKQGDGCWEWVGYKKRGYGSTRAPKSRAQFFAHRVAYYLANGADPDEMEVCHTCDNPACVRPDHLFLGTQADNMADKIAKGRHRSGPSKGGQNGNAKLSEADARLVIEAIMAGESNTAISQRYPIGHTLVSRIRTGKAWRHVATELGYTPAPAKYAPKSGRTAFGGPK